MFIFFRIMFKIKSSKGKSSCLMDNQLAIFLSRQLNVLREVCQSIKKTDKKIIQNRIEQCIHLIDSKIKFMTSENPQQYHDYIQDFYENQMMNFRNQNSELQTKISLKNEEIQELYKAIEELKITSSRELQQSPDFQQIISLKKELDKSKILLQQNTCLLQEQNLTIKTLTKALKKSQKQTQKVKKEYQTKILCLDQQINTNKNKFNSYFNLMTQQFKISERNIKQFSINSVRAVENSNQLAKQLEIKYEEIRLLTKKVFESQTLISKYERSISVKDQTISQFQQELQRINLMMQELKIRASEQKVLMQEKQFEIKGFEERIQLLNMFNSDLQKKIAEKCSRFEKIQKQIREKKNLIDQLNSENFTLESKIQTLERVIQEKDSRAGQINNQKVIILQKIKEYEQNISQLSAENRSIKQNMKQSIVEEVQELVSMIEKQKQTIKKLTKEHQIITKLYEKLKQANEELQNKFNTVTSAMDHINEKLDALQTQNTNLYETNALLTNQNARLNEINNSLMPLEGQCLALREEKYKLEKTISCFGNQKSSSINERKNNLQELVQSLENQLKLAKQSIHKKDFQIKQNESRIKILQEDLRNISVLYQNQKIKMNRKVKELEQLLKDDLTSRKSNPSNNL